MPEFMVTLKELEIKILLPEFWVDPHKMTQDDVNSLRSAIENARSESDIQTYLYKHPYFLVEL